MGPYRIFHKVNNGDWEYSYLPLDSIGKLPMQNCLFIRRTSIAGTTDMDVQVYSSKEKASVIVDGKVVRDDPVMMVNGLLSLCI